MWHHVICAGLWLFGRQFGLHLVYLGRPLQAVLWYLAGDNMYTWTIDLLLISRYLEELNAVGSEFAQPKPLNTGSLLAYEVWLSTLLTEAATRQAAPDVQREWLVLIPIATVPLGVWWQRKWQAGTNYTGVSWKAALGSGVVGFGLCISLITTIIQQLGPEAEELLSQTEQTKFLIPLLSTTTLHMWQQRSWLTAQCLRLLKLLVKLVLVLLVAAVIIFLIVQPHHPSSSNRESPNDDKNSHHDTHHQPLTEQQKLLRACEVLSVHPGVSVEMLTVAYRHLVRQWHPDKHRSQHSKDAASQRFIQIQEAYQYMYQRLTGGKRK